MRVLAWVLLVQYATAVCGKLLTSGGGSSSSSSSSSSSDSNKRKNPVAVEVPLQRPEVDPCVVPLIDLARFGLVPKNGAALQRVSPPRCAASTNAVKMVVLEMEAAVDGRQFDRMGGFWIDNCKLLHLTTAEPLNPGRVAWSVERDVTPFARMLVGRSMPFDAILDIPNIVQGPYTGVINVTVRALIYYDPQGSMQLAPLPLVFPLRAPFRDPRSPLKGAIVSGTERLKLPPFRCEACGSSSVQLELALYSTGHGGAEEFYYLEAPGGSPFRELVVYLDGEPVAATVPFPVVYTGGINPLLWRPLSAILALNVPPYSLDLTPLAPVLGDGAEHYFEIGVLNNSKTGQWNLDPILLVSTGRQAREARQGALPGSFPEPPVRAWTWPSYVSVRTPGGVLVRTQTHTFALGPHDVSIALTNVVENGVVSGQVEELLTSRDGGLIENRTFTFSVMEEDGPDFISAAVNQTRSLERKGEGKGFLALESTYFGHAFYNMSKGGQRSAAATQAIRVWDHIERQRPCFENVQSATNGTRETDLPTESAARCDTGSLNVVPCGSSFCPQRQGSNKQDSWLQKK